MFGYYFEFSFLRYAIFLGVVLGLYWTLPTRLAWRNGILLTASALFYSWWNPALAGMFFLSIYFDFYLAKLIDNTPDNTLRRNYMLTGIAWNVAALFAVKYLLTAVTKSKELALMFGIEFPNMQIPLITIVGISYLAFTKMGYIIDVYRRIAPAEREFTKFALFVSFFPVMPSGPIERSTTLLPQLQTPRVFSQPLFKDGVRQILWGIVKKAVVADNLRGLIDPRFDSPQYFSGIDLAVGAILFGVQLYCDFSGYSDVAVGTGKLFGFQVTRNFQFPYFSRDISEFWRKWHVSLSSWLRDYVYIPLGGAYGGKLATVRNVMVTFTLCGLWHGAEWHYIAWGFVLGVFFIPFVLYGKREKRSRFVAKGRLFPGFKELRQIFVTCMLVEISYVFFRAKSVPDALSYFSHTFSTSWLVLPTNVAGIALAVGAILIEWFQRNHEHAFQLDHVKRPLRWGIYGASIVVITMIGRTTGPDFIYFGF